MRWKPSLRVGIAVAAFALVTTACGEQQPIGEGNQAPKPSVAENPQFEAGTTMAKLAEAGTIRVGTKFDQPLFGLQGLNGELTGFDPEIARIIAGALGITPDKIQFVEAPSGQREELIKQNKV